MRKLVLCRTTVIALEDVWLYEQMLHMGKEHPFTVKASLLPQMRWNHITLV